MADTTCKAGVGKGRSTADSRWALPACFASSTAVEFDFASGSAAARIRSSWDRSPDSNTPSTGCFADRTSRSNIAGAVTWAVESLEGLRNDGEMDH